MCLAGGTGRVWPGAGASGCRVCVQRKGALGVLVAGPMNRERGSGQGVKGGRECTQRDRVVRLFTSGDMYSGVPTNSLNFPSCLPRRGGSSSGSSGRSIDAFSNLAVPKSMSLMCMSFVSSTCQA
eukprot:6181707-Pleurochrysis_carterae.AAC.1